MPAVAWHEPPHQGNGCDASDHGFGRYRRDAAELIANCDEYHEQISPCVHANLSAAEQEEAVVSPRGPSTVRRFQERIRTNETLQVSQSPGQPSSRRPTRPTCSDQALQSTRRSTLLGNITPTSTVATPSVVVPPQATAIPRLGKENIPHAEPVSRLTRASRSRN